MNAHDRQLNIAGQARAYRAANPGMTFAESHALAVSDAENVQAEKIAASAAKFAEGTGAKNLAAYAAKVDAGERLTRREIAAVRRAIELGKDVPPALSAAAYTDVDLVTSTYRRQLELAETTHEMDGAK